MLTEELIISAEKNLMLHCSRMVGASFGYLLYNESNRDSHDCNHACITVLSDIESSLSAIEAFYLSLGLTPRIFNYRLKNEYEILRPFLDGADWTHELNTGMRLMEYAGKSVLTPPQTSLEARLVHEVDDELYNLYLQNDGGPWCAIAARECLEYGSMSLFAGYENGVVCCSAAVEHDKTNALSLVQDVFTNEKFRGRGYARDLMRYLLKYETENFNNEIYLWVENPVAVKVYKDVGFAFSDMQPESWRAYKNIILP